MGFGLLQKVNEWFLHQWKLACTPSWMSPQNASSEFSSSKHEELLKPSPESTRTSMHKQFFWVCVFFFLFKTPPAVPMLDRIGTPFLKLGKLIFPLTSMIFFCQKESVGTLLVNRQSSLSLITRGEAFTMKALSLFKWFWF